MTINLFDIYEIRTAVRNILRCARGWQRGEYRTS